MRTLILNGSPRKNGDTAQLIAALVKKLEGETKEFSSYRDRISPCIDCRHCWQKPECKIDDDMQEVYKCIETYDTIVIASPLHFNSLSGSLLGLLSRLQMYYAANHILKAPIPIKEKKAVLILTGGQGFGEQEAQEQAKRFFRLIRGKDMEVVGSLQTDKLPARIDQVALERIASLAGQLNKARKV